MLNASVEKKNMKSIFFLIQTGTFNNDNEKLLNIYCDKR